jgi:hypothetical protein
MLFPSCGNAGLDLESRYNSVQDKAADGTPLANGRFADAIGLFL